MTPPVNGRVLWYWPSTFDRGLEAAKPPSIIHADGVQPCAAQVAYVHGNQCVNLTVIDHNGRHHPRTSVMLLQDNDQAAPGLAYAEWMPYQKGQAAATEAAQAATKEAAAPST